MTQAIGLAAITVLTYAIIGWADLHLYWTEFGLFWVAVVGIGAAVARGGGKRSFLKAATTSFLTVLTIGSMILVHWFRGPVATRPEVLPSPAIMVMAMVWLSLLMGALSGAVALGVRRFVAGRERAHDPMSF
jgi:hypothetical protein